MSKKISRRNVLRGVVNGGLVSISLPFLEAFLNTSGSALASGAPLPSRFGTWFWGLGMNKSVFTPKKTGLNFDLPEELQAIAPVREHINLFSNFRVNTDGRPNLCHFTGWVGLRCGVCPPARDVIPNETIDVTVSDAIGGGTRFKSLDMNATGDPRLSYSARSTHAVNAPEISTLALYNRVFGPDFQDPNAPTFTPDPKVMLRRSILSSVMEDSAALQKELGRADQVRLDEYFTSLRGLENRLAVQLEKPEPIAACVMPEAPREVAKGLDVELVAERHRLMTDILVMALTCNQTRVFNMFYSDAFSSLVKKGMPSTHHVATHEEAIEPELGYQPNCHFFTLRAMDEWAYFVNALASVPEGDGTLLDNTLVYAHSDQEFAKIHSINGIPMMTAGTAGGKVKTGYHIDGKNEEVGTRVGLTAMHAMGVDIESWGSGSMRTSQPISEILI